MIKELLTKKATVVALPKAAKKTPVNFRLTVTVEDEQGQSNTVLGLLFNESGDIVEVKTVDTNLRNRILEKDWTEPVLNCREVCDHHLADGNAPAYAVCWWSCVTK